MKITFKNFLTEQNTYYSINEGFELIKNNCKDFLSKTSLPLYRGMDPKLITDQVFYSTHPTNRQPTFQDKTFNYMFNSAFELALDIPNIRMSSLFTTGNENMPYNYGDSTFCFPSGSIEYLWSPQILDSVSDMDLIYKYIEKKLPKNIFNNNYTIVNFIRDVRRSLNGKLVTNDINKANSVFEKIFSKNGLPDNIFSVNDFAEALKNVCTSLYKVDSELSEAQRTGNEILFFKTNGYYTLPLRTIAGYAINKNIPKIGNKELYNFALSEIDHAGK